MNQSRERIETVDSPTATLKNKSLESLTDKEICAIPMVCAYERMLEDRRHVATLEAIDGFDTLGSREKARRGLP